MLRTFLKFPITVERLTDDAGADTEGYISNGTIYGFITAISPEDTMISEGNPAKSAVLFCEVNSDIQKSDRITYHDGTVYTVSTVKKPQSLFSVQYRRCIIQELQE